MYLYFCPRNERNMLNILFPLLLNILLQPTHSYFPAGTTASRWTSDVVLCYIDARSTPAGGFGPAATTLFGWNQTRFERLLAYHDNSSDQGGGKPIDTLFDSFLFSGNTWYDGKMFWPGLGLPMNQTDWLGYLDLVLELGVTNLEAAAHNVSSHLPFPQDQSCTTSGGLHPAVVLGIPYPSTAQQNFGSIDASGRSLNFTIEADRLAAVEWWLQTAYTRFQSKKYTRARLSGFYWFYEEITPDDETMVPKVNQKIHSIDTALMSVWIPYYRPGDPHTARWKELGFDFATLQPNYAFNNVSANERFPAIKELIDEANVGVELEINVGIRNPQAGGWQGNFDTYIERVNAWQAESGSIMRTYYYGNVFVTDYASNRTIFEYYTKLFRFVKGIRGGKK